MKTEKQPLAEKMRELTASAQYRKCIAEMNKLHRVYSTVRYVYLSNPWDQTLEMLKDQGFKVEQTAIKEYVQFKISW